MQMHNGEIRVAWNPDVFKEVNEAKKVYLQARKESRDIKDDAGNCLDLFNPSAGVFVVSEKRMLSHEFAMRIFDETGDRRLIWDSRDQDQVKECAKLFNDYLKKGWKPYAINSKGEKGRRIYGFDADTQEIIFDDSKNVREKLASFVEKFREVKVVPRTYPG